MACILGKTVDGHELGLHIRRESRVFSRSEIDAFGALVHFNMYPVGAGRNLCTHFTNLVQSGFEYIIARFRQCDIAACCGNGAKEGSGLDPVRNDFMFCTVQTVDAMNDKAEEYPEIIFSHATGYMGNDTNFNNYFGRIYQARYLTGVAAGLKSLEMGNNSIGYVAAYNREYAETCSGINAFALGVQAVNPDAVVHVNKISTWGDENLERQAAQALIDTYDCCVIGQHCDSAQPQLVAAENNVFGCGYNSDMTEQAPNAHLTAAIWHWDVYYQAAIETAMTCGGAENFVTEMGGNAYYAGLSEGFVDASTLNELVAAPGTAAAMEAVRELIDSGEWDVFSGVKLNITVDAEAGTAAVEQVDAPLMSDGYELKDGEVVEMANPEIVPAGGASVTDDVIKSGMNYNVAGVVEG